MTSWCLTSGYGKNEDEKKTKGETLAKIVAFLLKLVLKILLLPVAFLLRFRALSESADAAIPVGAFAGYAVRSWLRHLFCGSGELDGCVPADPD